MLALALALVVNQRLLKGKSFFRTAFYFPSVTSSVAISVVFLFLFTNGGAVNAVLGLFGIHGPQWFADPRGLLHMMLGGVGLVDPDSAAGRADRATSCSGCRGGTGSSGPSVAMCAIIALVVWTTVRHLHADVPRRAAEHPGRAGRGGLLDGATAGSASGTSPCPLLKPTLFLVLTLGLIGTWQVFDQVYVMSQGNPAKTTLTPGVPVLPHRVPRLQLRLGRGDLVHPLPASSSCSRCCSAASCATGTLGSAAAWRRLVRRHAVTAREPARRAARPARARRRRPRRRYRRPSRSPAAVATRIAGYAVLVFFALLFIYPFVIQLANSFKTEPDAAANPLSPVPIRCRRTAIERIFVGTDFPPWLANSVLVTVVVTIGRVFFDSLAGYALARLRFRGRRALFATVIGDDGRARRGAADPEVPGAQAARPLQQLRRR